MVAYYSDCPAILLCPPTARTGPKGPCWTTTTADCAECADASAGPAAASKGTPIPAAAKTSELIVLGVLLAPPIVRPVRPQRAGARHTGSDCPADIASSWGKAPIFARARRGR